MSGFIRSPIPTRAVKALADDIAAQVAAAREAQKDEVARALTKVLHNVRDVINKYGG